MTGDYLTVTALTKYIKRKFEQDPYLERVYLTGEISNFRNRPNAHQYFSLKDDRAKI
ncbi:MAG: exodeoxyribonuclease VII large subunit, partial [Carnobacterium sp.]